MIVQISTILNKLIEGNPDMPRISWEFKISNAWGKVNPANVAQNSSPEKLVGGVLYINAKNSAWAQQINLLKPEIILKLNAFIGEPAVKDIRLKTGYTADGVSPAAEKLTKNCGNCGVEFIGDEKLCPTCLREAKKSNEIKLIRLVDRNPKIGLGDVRLHMPNTEDIDLHRAKRDVLARKADQNYRERRQRGKKGS
jgi:Dna[CI] antecedent, DciA